LDKRMSGLSIASNGSIKKQLAALTQRLLM
jgi:hypothetical protein